MKEQEDRNARAQLEMTEKTLPLEWTCEWTLPDYCSEVSRLLSVKPEILPPSRFFGGNKLDLSGTVHYRALYAGPDGGLSVADREEDYAFSVPLETAGFDTAEGVECEVTFLPEALLCRVAAPRKLSLRLRLRVRARVFADRSLTPVLRGAEEREKDAERLCFPVTNSRIFTGGGSEFGLDSAFLPEVRGENRFLPADACVLFSEVNAVPDGVRCRGEVMCSFFAVPAQGGAPTVVTHTIPFEETVPLPGVTPDCDACGNAVIREIRIVPGEEGEPAAVSVTGMLSATAQRAEETLATADLFVPGEITECRRVPVRFMHPTACRTRHFSVTGDLSGGGIPAGAMLLFATGEAIQNNRRVEEKRTMLSGEIACHLLFLAGNEYGTAQATLPFRVSCEGDLSQGEAMLTVPVLHVSGEGEHLRADGEVQLSMRAFAEQNTDCVNEALCRHAPERTLADLELIYPAKGETLFSLCRRLSLPITKTAEANGLSAEDPGRPDSLAGVRRLRRVDC